MERIKTGERVWGASGAKLCLGHTLSFILQEAINAVFANIIWAVFYLKQLGRVVSTDFHILS